MHQTIPYATTTVPGGAAVAGGSGEPNGVDPANVIRMVSENAVMVIGRRGCCMCHVVQRLLQGLGVNPPVYEVDEGDEAVVTSELSRKIVSFGGDGGGTVQFPAVFVGGKWFGGLERVMATHISGELVPILKDAGALWL
ncbi:glutaredoxin-C9-like [Gastrolobium bilobum]|uniref:glutaredoxin-C9-like n=1 Tax=Gastrolobium bilobum TaxID=150636 RepID=UPI002AB28369|nr:glutaredoxin-C9-like [Gastrolobium bilobum]